MKKILLALSLALVSTAFVACNQKELDNQKATIDSLQSVVEAKDTEINDLFDMLNDIEENMSAISSKYSSVQELRRNNTEGSYNHKNEIASQMKSIESMMAENKQKIANLNAKVNSLSKKNADLQAYITRLEERSQAQENQIAELLTELENNKVVIKGLNKNVSELTASNQQKDEYIAIYGTPEERFKLLPPGIPADRKRPSEEEAERRREAKRKELDVAEDETLLLQVGSGFRTKGVDRSIVAFAALPDDFREHIRLVVAGRGRERPLERLARKLGVDDRVKLLGARDDVPDLLLAADLLVHPARNEATGTVLLESLACGTPVLCSSNCGFALQVREAGNPVLPGKFRQKLLNRTLMLILSTPGRVEELQREAENYGANADFYRRAQVAVDLILERLGHAGA